MITSPMSVILNLPVPISNAAGAAVDVSSMGATKTIIVGGVFNATVTIEYSTAPAGNLWAPIQSFQGPGRAVVDLAVQRLRAVTSSYVSGTPSADVAADFSPALFAQLSGAVDISAFPEFKTVVVDGPCNVEISDDGTSYNQVLSFQNAGGQSGVFSARLGRVTGGAVCWIGGATGESGSGGGSAQPSTLVFNPFYFSARGNIYTDFPSLMAAKRPIDSTVLLQFDNTRQGFGIALSIPVAGTVRLTQANPLTPFAANMVGQTIMISGDAALANNGAFTVTAVLSATVIEFANAAGVGSAGFTGRWVVVGGGGTNNVTIPPPPAGQRWDMTQTEWFAVANPYASPGAGVVPVAISDGCTFINLEKIGGDIAITNLNNASACVQVAAPIIFEFGLGTVGDFPTLANNGTAPFWDCSALTAGQIFTLRLAGQISGTSAAVQFGVSPGVLNFNLGTFGRFRSGMAAGTNPAANINVANIGEQNEFGRQNAWSGNISHGSQSGLLTNSGGTNIPRGRRQMFPISIQQAAPIPTGVAFTNATGLGHNGSYEITTNTVGLAQSLPVIRSAAPPIGSAATAIGALDSTGMRVTFKHIDAGLGGSIAVSPAAGETIDGGAGPVIVPTGGAREFESDGVSNWRVVGGYL